MCGIVGYVGSENAVSYLLNGLKKLEYRGYDSSGIVVGKFENNEPKFYLYKKVGKLKQLISALPRFLGNRAYSLGNAWTCYRPERSSILFAEQKNCRGSQRNYRKFSEFKKITQR